MAVGWNFVQILLIYLQTQLSITDLFVKDVIILLLGTIQVEMDKQ